MTSRSDISRELELEGLKKEEKRKEAERKKKARKFFRMQTRGSPGAGRDFPTKRKGGKIMVGYKAGGKV
tara:strand:- start:361 stop:567 length:207 start_codon:yes stop_codon:yes gene_type:complete